MNDAIVSALAGETVVHANPIATVTRNCLVVRYDVRQAQAIIGLESIRGMRKVNFTNPALLVIAAGLFLIAAAAYSSHEAHEVSASLSAVGLLFLLAYFLTRRATVLFLLENQNIESKRGSYREATSIIRAVERVRAGNLERVSVPNEDRLTVARDE
jgi:hypothetical protein